MKESGCVAKKPNTCILEAACICQKKTLTKQVLVGLTNIRGWTSDGTVPDKEHCDHNPHKNIDTTTSHVSKASNTCNLWMSKFVLEHSVQTITCKGDKRFEQGNLRKFGPVLRQISWTFTDSLWLPQRPCSSTSNASTCCWHKGYQSIPSEQEVFTLILQKKGEISARMQCFCTAPYTNVSSSHSPPLVYVFWQSERSSMMHRTL
jgi:hypothetical protein